MSDRLRHCLRDVYEGDDPTGSRRRQDGAALGLVQCARVSGNTFRGRDGDDTNPKRKRGLESPSLTLRVSVPELLPDVEPGEALHVREDGMVSLITVIAVLFFLVLLGLVGNVAKTVTRKIETQNAADAVTYSAALTMARSMNAVTAANHMLGELTAIIVLIDALAGREMKSGGLKEFNDDSAESNRALKTVRAVFWLFDWEVGQLIKESGDENLFTKDKGKDSAAGAISDGRVTLKNWLWHAIALHGVGATMEKTPAAAAGEVLKALAKGFIYWIRFEWNMLKLLEGVAKDLVSVRKGLVELLVPAVAGYAVLVEGQTPLAVLDAVHAVSQANGGTAVAIYPNPLLLELGLPLQREAAPVAGNHPPPRVTDREFRPRWLQKVIDIVKEIRRLNGLNFFKPPFDPLSDNVKEYKKNPSWKGLDKFKYDFAAEKESQWARATYPWVRAWRVPVLNNMKWLVLSDLARWYHNWTGRYTLIRSVEFRAYGTGGPDRPSSPLFMYVMMDSKLGQKGKEPWTEETAKGAQSAEKLFTVVGHVLRPASVRISPAIYPQPNPRQPNAGGLVAYAQAMVYNANGKAKERGSRLQPEIGWDTLNWAPGDNRVQEYDVDPGSDGRPEIKLNWQAKLVPVTLERLREAQATKELLPSGIFPPAVPNDALTNH